MGSLGAPVVFPVWVIDVNSFWGPDVGYVVLVVVEVIFFVPLVRFCVCVLVGG